jgi:hypothetical protein
MKTIEIEITTNTTRKVALELPVYFKRNNVFYAITEKNKVIKVDTEDTIESINVYNFPESHFKEDAEIITEKEFDEKFTNVLEIIKGILL